VAVGVASDRVGEAEGDLPDGYLGTAGFSGELGQLVAVPVASGGTRYLVGLGKAAAVGADQVRSAAAVVGRAAGRHRSLTLDLAGGVDGGGPELAAAQAEGALLGAYRFDAYRSKPKPHELREVLVVAASGRAGAADRAAVERGVALADATNLARDLVNEPGGALTAPVFAERTVAAAKGTGVKVTVHDMAAIKRLGFGGLLAVNQGSTVPPRFLELAYDPKGASTRTPVVALVGKGITFDSGGLSIKTAEGMTNMKGDMGGGAAVVAAMTALAALDVPVAVRGYVPLTDNMTGGNALRVADVITHYGGSTTEVLNTDAEGRLILADALAWATAKRRGNRLPAAVLDLATLTGACMVALGTRTAGLFSDDDDLADRVLDAAAGAGERLWRLPLVDADKKGLESKVADRKNVAGRYGGAITAGLFLRDFVGNDVPWAHLDIAGPAFNEAADDLEVPAGGTGYGVRTLLRLLADWPG
jgi:leucyl aminopeptidase